MMRCGVGWWPRSSYRLPRSLIFALVTCLLVVTLPPRLAQAQVNPYCHLSNTAISQKESLRQGAIQGDAQARQQYQDVLKQHADLIDACRQRNWPRRQAVWVRLYPCDTRPGVLEALLDRMVNRGYSHVYVEAFYNGQVLLPKNQNRTPWPSVIQEQGQENRDLLAEVIQKGHERGLTVYAWMFTLNFGYSYAQQPQRRQVLARNGAGQDTLTASIEGGIGADMGGVSSEEVFVDPYNNQARTDYYLMAQEIVRRRPDGMLFDYVRYPRGRGAASVASDVDDLWIHGSAARQALIDRGLNQKGRYLIQRFLDQGYIAASDIEASDRNFPTEGEPMWQGRTPPPPSATPIPAGQRRPLLQAELWYLSVAHAYQGVLDFVEMAATPARQAGMPTGVVFFPGGNRRIGQGFDSRLQPWDRFSAQMEWHPMVYGICGNTGCITSEVREVLNQAPGGTAIYPVIAGTWGQSMSNRPALDVQMQSIRQTAAGLPGLSHFAYSWQDPEFDRVRKFCRN